MNYQRTFFHSFQIGQTKPSDLLSLHIPNPLFTFGIHHHRNENNIPVFNVIRNAEPVADFALGLMLDITRNITLSDKFIRNGQWMHEYYNTGQIKLFNGHLVGLVGIGNAGRL